MEALRLALLFLHLVGMAAILGGFLTQLRDRRVVVSAMFHGAIAQLVTGVVLVAVRETQDLENTTAKLAAKIAIAAAVLAAAWLGQRRDRQIVFFYATGLLTAVNVAVAVFWT